MVLSTCNQVHCSSMGHGINVRGNRSGGSIRIHVHQSSKINFLGGLPAASTPHIDHHTKQCTPKHDTKQQQSSPDHFNDHVNRVSLAMRSVFAALARSMCTCVACSLLLLLLTFDRACRDENVKIFQLAPHDAQRYRHNHTASHRRAPSLIFVVCLCRRSKILSLAARRRSQFHSNTNDE